MTSNSICAFKEHIQKDGVSGLAGIFGGIYGSSWSIGYELGKNYGPSKWFAPEQYESVILERLKTNKIE